MRQDPPAGQGRRVACLQRERFLRQAAVIFLHAEQWRADFVRDGVVQILPSVARAGRRTAAPAAYGLPAMSGGAASGNAASGKIGSMLQGPGSEGDRLSPESAAGQGSGKQSTSRPRRFEAVPRPGHASAAGANSSASRPQRALRSRGPRPREAFSEDRPERPQRARRRAAGCFESAQPSWFQPVGGARIKLAAGKEDSTSSDAQPPPTV